MKSIIKKIRFFGFLISLLIAVILGINIFLNLDTERNAKIVNIAGKQRMLTQKITNELYILKVSNSLEFTKLDSLITEYETNLKYLRFGKESEKPIKITTIENQLIEINKLWVDYSNEIEKLKLELNNIKREREINSDLIEQILSVSDTVVSLLEKNNFSPKTINVAGRQRMLTQKMAYHNLQYLLGNQKFDYDKFQTSLEEYDETIKSFLHNEKIGKFKNLHEVIQVNFNFWQDTSRMLVNMVKTNRHINSIFEKVIDKNEKLITKADDIVSMYQRHFYEERTEFSSIQYFFALIAFVVVLSLASIINEIKRQFDKFLDKTKKLSEFDSEITKLETTGEKELDEASSNINTFIGKVEAAIISSDEAVKHSEKAIDEINNLVDAMEEKALNKEEMRSFSKNEDMAIQSSEELLQAVSILNKLKENLNNYKNTS